MADIVQDQDFVELDYTGQLEEGDVFDTTIEAIAHKNHLNHAHGLKAVVICVGEHQLLPGLDEKLVGKEIGKEYTFTLEPEEAFGKRDIKKVEMIPLQVFKEHKLQPHPGLQFDADGRRGVVTKVSGGRVLVNYNHPLAGKTVQYTINVKRKIQDVKEKVQSFLHAVFHLPSDSFKVEITENKANVELPFALPQQFVGALVSRIVTVTKLEAVNITAKSPPASPPEQ